MNDTKAVQKIAILGWGSLIWDDGWPIFDSQHDAWQKDGPALPLEFSRISSSRHGALTLVIDDQNGVPCKVMYALSRRKQVADAIADLRDREGTTMRNIGFWFRADHTKKGEPTIPDSIVPWAEEKQIDVVVWTGLPSNFAEKNYFRKGEPFSINAALAHLQMITPQGKAAAATYIWRAPDLVRTPLRTRLQAEPWFSAQTGRN